MKTQKNKINIQGRMIGEDYKPFIIAEIGINHAGNFKKAKKMIDDAKKAGAECVKFQSHILEDEMTEEAKKIVPSNARKSIWEIIRHCSLTEEEEKELKKYVEKLGMIYLCTPFSRLSANRLAKMKVSAFKIGSGECNNYPLVGHIASFGKPVILSTGMNNIKSINKSVNILEKARVEYALLHCTSMYPTPYEKVRLNALNQLRKYFKNAVIGLSDHSLGNYTSFAAIAMRASIIEKHFVSDKRWVGPDISISITPSELKDLIKGSWAIHKALKGKKTILKEEASTIKFAYASVVATKNVKKGEHLTKDNLWVKRPGTGEIKSEQFCRILGKKAKKNIKKNTQLRWDMLEYT